MVCDFMLMRTQHMQIGGRDKFVAVDETFLTKKKLQGQGLSVVDVRWSVETED